MRGDERERERANDAVRAPPINIPKTHPARFVPTSMRHADGIPGVIRLVCRHQLVPTVLHGVSCRDAAPAREAHASSWFPRNRISWDRCSRTRLPEIPRERDSGKRFQRVEYPNGDDSCAILITVDLLHGVFRIRRHACPWNGFSGGECEATPLLSHVPGHVHLSSQIRSSRFMHTGVRNSYHGPLPSLDSPESL